MQKFEDQSLPSPTRKLRRLLLVTYEDPWNPVAWSGIPFQIREALERQVETLSDVGALKPRRSKWEFVRHLAHRRHPIRYPLELASYSQRQYAHETQQAIDRHNPEAILAISSPCIIKLAPQSIPIFMVSDAPWIAWKETYRQFEHMPLLGPSFGRREAAAAHKCAGIIYPSKWAIEEGKRLFQVPDEKLHIQPMGANWKPDLPDAQLHAIIDQRPDHRVDFLYVGKDWPRKGGPLAVEIVLALQRAGISGAHLHVVGCSPEIDPAARDFVTVHGRLAASDPKQSAHLRALFLNSHFLLVPTQAECYGLVFAEAQAFGLPPVSRAVQAVPSIIADGEAGFVLPPGEGAAAYVKRLIPVIEDRSQYRRMAHAARRRYEEKLNWMAFAAGVVKTIEASL